MAEEEDDLLPIEEAEQSPAPVEDDGPVNEDPIANLASELGWVPKEQFRGDPEKWKPADQFIRDGRDIQQTLSRELRTVKQEVERFGRVAADITEDRVRQRDDYWRQQHRQAVEVGDLEAADKAVEELRKVRQDEPSGPPPETQEWIGRNQWFNKDPLAQARAVEICERLKHLPVSEQLAQAERGIRKEFPEHFSTPAKQPPATQTGSSRKAAPSNRARGFADMPAESQKMARDMVRRNPSVTLEAIASSYWADVARTGRA